MREYRILRCLRPELSMASSTTSLMTPFQEVYYSNTEPRLGSFHTHDHTLQAPLCQFVSQCAWLMITLMVKGARSNFATSSVIVSYDPRHAFETTIKTRSNTREAFVCAPRITEKPDKSIACFKRFDLTLLTSIDMYLHSLQTFKIGLFVFAFVHA
jgi:hypothetical protein